MTLVSDMSGLILMENIKSVDLICNGCLLKLVAVVIVNQLRKIDSSIISKKSLFFLDKNPFCSTSNCVIV
jgi:hypothetical protein